MVSRSNDPLEFAPGDPARISRSGEGQAEDHRRRDDPTNDPTNRDRDKMAHQIEFLRAASSLLAIGRAQDDDVNEPPTPPEGVRHAATPELRGTESPGASTSDGLS
jgi:hypothetical protein